MAKIYLRAINSLKKINDIIIIMHGHLLLKFLKILTSIFKKI